MINSRNMADLHPTVARAAKMLVSHMAEKGYEVLITSTYRDNEKQNALYAQGRTTPGNIVTNAKAGQSIHNYRLAFDICKNKKGAEYADAAFFQAAGFIWNSMGGEWGGNWKNFSDKPHFEFTGGLTLSQLQQGKRLANDIKMLWETQKMPWETQKIQEALKGALEVVTKTQIKIDEKIYTIDRILKDGSNFISLRGLEAAGVVVTYDQVAKMPVIYLPK